VLTDKLLYVPNDIYPLISRYIINKEDVYITVAGTIGAIGTIPDELDGANLTENADRIVFCMLNQFWLVKCLQSFLIQNQIAEVTTKVGQPKLAIKRIQNLIIPLPPLAEQHRIVAKIEELMPLVEKYDEAQEALDEWNKALPEKLKKSILQEAIQGRLVPQDPTDEPASALLERIREEKKRLVKEGKLKKKDLEVKPIEEKEIPFEIPESWEWCRIEDITIPIGNKTNQIQSKEVLKTGKVPVVSQGQKLIDGYSNEVDKTIEELPLIMFGDHTKNVKFIDFPFVIGADGTKFFKPIFCDAQFVYYIVLYEASKLRNRGYARHYTLLKDEPLPLPPLAEQRRIVAKIEELFGVIEKK
jgi:type I restriction enzyme S subunit